MSGMFGDGNPSANQGGELPVENITWRHVCDFIAAGNVRLAKRKVAGGRIRR